MRNRTNIISQCLSLTTLGLLCASNASAANVIFDGAGLGGIQSYTDAANWTGVVGGDGIPTSADDATATGRFQLNDGSTRELNSLTVNGAGSFMSSVGTKLNITTDFTLNSTLAINNATGIEWGGQATIGDGIGNDTLSLIYGTHRDPSMVIGKDLDVAANGKIQLRWFTAGAEGSIVPEIDLSGALDFAAGSIFEVNLEGGSTGNALTEGTYFLIGSTNITGSATLSLIDFEADQANSFLSIVDTGGAATQGLYLTVAVPEPSSAALIGLGGFALILRRRR